ncbi:unnamed protein product [Miscanthus lutarioriparius]|uniref:Carbonic anhydrase n=1 Tax=Miscanthus lutarioriparius TaxID=422564 RepID=A0A811NC85_9POAL|nr:unnamed protein product [Miscanthus lutarioriparius]CAD6341539.1 unnamed protein product [Miscanthus lutarioriparius]
MPRRRNNVALAIVLVVFAFCARYASAVGSTPHSTFSYKEGDPTGPEKWATLQKDWAICDSGTKQSPIDVAKVEVSKDLGPLEQNYKAGAAVVQNRGHDFMLNWTGGNGDLTIEGKKYTLLQVHWHAPSEHTVNGTRFDAEMHMVHEDSTKSKAVVAVLFSTKAGKPSKLLGDLKPYFERLAGKQNATEEVKGTVDPTAWIDNASGYYRYEGSFTTPPCTEGVLWSIMSKVADASKDEIDSIDRVKKSSVEPNARPAQTINSRVVRYYKAGATEGSAPAPAPAPGPT